MNYSQTIQKMSPLTHYIPSPSRFKGCSSSTPTVSNLWKRVCLIFVLVNLTIDTTFPFIYSFGCSRFSRSIAVVHLDTQVNIYILCRDRRPGHSAFPLRPFSTLEEVLRQIPLFRVDAGPGGRGIFESITCRKPKMETCVFSSVCLQLLCCWRWSWG